MTNEVSPPLPTEERIPHAEYVRLENSVEVINEEAVLARERANAAYEGCSEAQRGAIDRHGLKRPKRVRTRRA